MEKERKPSYKYCLVPKCKSTTISTPDKVFFFIPRNTDMRKKWCEAMKREKDLSPTTCLYCCEDHFDLEEDTENYIQYKIMKDEGKKVTLHLKKHVAPHKFQSEKDKRSPSPELNEDIKKQRTALVEEALSEYDAKYSTSEASESNINVDPQLLPKILSVYVKSESCSSFNESEYCEVLPCEFTPVLLNSNGNEKIFVDKAIQVKSKVRFRSKGINVNLDAKKKNTLLTDASTSPTKPITTSLKRELCYSNSADNTSAKNILQSSELTIDYEIPEDDSSSDKPFKNSMQSIILTAIERHPKFFLGLPKKAYYLIKLLSENISLAVIDILITLKKIKLNESFNTLAIHFGYTQNAVSRIFSKSIPILAEELKELIVWPTPLEIQNKLPISFKENYENVVSIIDCLEIEIEKPPNVNHQSFTWSENKNCNTLKYFISYTPDGYITFISEGYGGKTTDITIVENCGYLDCLPPETAVIVHTGFEDLSNLLEERKCSLVRLPPVSKEIVSLKELEEPKTTETLKSHVEHVINRLKEFKMLLPNACLEHYLIPFIDEVIVVASGIINLWNPSVKKEYFA